MAPKPTWGRELDVLSKVHTTIMPHSNQQNTVNVCQMCYLVSQICCMHCTHTSKAIHTHTHTQPFYCSAGICPGHTRVSRYQKGKTRKVITNLDLLEQEIVSGSGICWAICKSAPHPRQPRQHRTTQNVLLRPSTQKIK